MPLSCLRMPSRPQIFQSPVNFLAPGVSSAAHGGGCWPAASGPLVLRGRSLSPDAAPCCAQRAPLPRRGFFTEPTEPRAPSPRALLSFPGSALCRNLLVHLAVRRSPCKGKAPVHMQVQNLGCSSTVGKLLFFVVVVVGIFSSF